MIFIETRLKGAFIIEIEKQEDERGFFARSYCQKEFAKYGLNPNFVQANIGFSKEKGTLRGLHYQEPPHEETKLVRCSAGAIFDVIVDLRPGSHTYKQWVGVELSTDNHTMLYVPEGFAHGYQTLMEDTEVLYQVSQFYAPQFERGVRWDDSAFSIRWPEIVTRFISDKDRSWPDFE